MIRPSRLATMAALAALACGRQERAPKPYVAEVLSHVGPGQYQVVVETITSLEDLDRMAGGAGWIQGGGHLDAGADPSPRTQQSMRKAFAMRGARTVRPEYDVDRGVVRAADYDTFAMLSIYRGMERVRETFRALGAPDEALRPMPIYYRSRVELYAFPYLAANNAAYSALVDGFLLFTEHLEGAGVPLALNLGVTAHEYAHALFNHLAWEGQVPQYLLEEWGNQAVNQLRALDEGLADFLGTVVTGDPRFVGRSVPDVGEERAVDTFRVLDQALLREASDPADKYDPYRLGSVIASMLWRTAEVIGPDEMGRYVISAEESVGGFLDSDFTINIFLSQLAYEARANTAHRQAICAGYAESVAIAGPFICCQLVCPP